MIPGEFEAGSTSLFFNLHMPSLGKTTHSVTQHRLKPRVGEQRRGLYHFHNMVTPRLFNIIFLFCYLALPASLEAACVQQPGWKFRSPFSCAQFFDCSAHTPTSGFFSTGTTSSSASATSGGSGGNSAIPGHSEHPLQLMECPYPSFYSTTTSSCQSFDKVRCGTRPQPKAPCKLNERWKKE